MHQDVALRVHVSEGGGDKHTNSSPPTEKREELVLNQSGRRRKQNCGQWAAKLLKLIDKATQGKAVWPYLNSGAVGIDITLSVV